MGSWWVWWLIAALAVLLLPWPASVIVGAPCGLAAGWRLAGPVSRCGWCGRRWRGTEWVCPRCERQTGEGE